MLNKYSKYVELNEDYITYEPSEMYTLIPTMNPSKKTNVNYDNNYNYNNNNNETILIITFTTLSTVVMLFILFYKFIYRKKSKKKSIIDEEFGTEFTLDNV
jgi:hypothetical protein